MIILIFKIEQKLHHARWMIYLMSAECTIINYDHNIKCNRNYKNVLDNKQNSALEILGSVILNSKIFLSVSV